MKDSREDRRAGPPPHLKAVEATDRSEGLDESSIDAETQAAIRESLASVGSSDRHFSQTLLPENTVVSVSFRDVEIGFVGNRRRWFAVFKIDENNLEREHIGKLIMKPYNAPTRPWLSPAHNLTRDWVAVTGLRPAQVSLKRSPRAVLGQFLKGCSIEATTKVVKRRMNPDTRKWENTPAELHYSVLKDLVRVVAGMPLVLRRRQ